MKHSLFCLALAAGSFQLATADSVYPIYPVPQQQVAVNGTVAFTSEVTLVCESDIDKYTVARAKSILTEAGFTVTEAAAPSATTANVLLGINGSEGVADAKVTALGLSRDVFAKASKYDRHIVSLTDNGDGKAVATIVGENTDATFIALASLEYMLEGDKTAMPCVTIYDYADQQNRGLVEGYYGVPYPAEVKKDLMRFMMRHKMNSYMYGAKSDTYHSSHWKEPYPVEITEEQRKIGYVTQDMMREINDMSHETKVNFIWAIHPGNSFLGSSTVVDDIMKKFGLMYDLGVRQFAIFVDDVAIPDTEADFKKNAERVTAVQRAIEKKWNKEGVAATDTVKPLQFVPQIYCSAFAGGGEPQRKGFFTALKETPKNVAIYTTGWGVWSVPNTSDVNQVKQYLNRDVAWWWNYPCNDNDHNKLFPMDMYSNFGDESRIDGNARVDNNLTACLGVLSNPMQQGEVSKIALFSVADYAWNNDAFDNASSWQASFPRIVGKELADDFRLLASYLRYYDGSSLSDLVNAYKTSIEAGNPDGAALKERMNQVALAAARLCALETSENESDRLLYEDLKPWLLKLRSMAEQVSEYITLASDHRTDDEKWSEYLEQLNKTNVLTTHDDYHAPALYGGIGANTLGKRLSEPAAQTLYPFVEYIKAKALHDYFPERELNSAPVAFTSVEGITPKVIYTASTRRAYISYNKVISLAKGDYIGIKLPAPTKVEQIEAKDTLVTNHSVVISADGKQWTRITTTKFKPDTYVRYLAVVNDNEAVAPIKLNSTSLRITMPEHTQIESAAIPSGNVWENHTANYIMDGDPATFACLNRNQQNNDAYTLTLEKSTEINDVRICMGTVNGDYMNKARVQTSADGKTWKDLTVKGTSIRDFTMNLSQVVKYNDEMSYCDFKGHGDNAKYVRLLVTDANVNKWLRLYDIQVNLASDAAFYQKLVDDASGQPALEAADNNGATALDRPEGGSITYHFQELAYIKALKIYADPAVSVPAKIAVTLNGEEWTELGDALTAPVQTVDLSATPEAVAVRISWTGNVTPAIYEIAEVADPDSKPTVTKIESITADGATGNAPNLSLANGRLNISATQGLSKAELFTVEGRRLITYSLNGERSAQLPATGVKGATGVLKVVTADGQSHSFKVVMK